MLKRLAVRVGAVCAGRRPTATAWWCPCWGSSPSDLCVGAQAFRLGANQCAARPEAALGELQPPLAQLGAWLVLQETSTENQIGFFASIDEAKFRRPVLPGDQLKLEVEVVRKRRNFVKLAGKAYVGDSLASEGILSIMIGSPPE